MPTPDVVDRYLERLTAEVRAVFGERVAGVWLLGSLAYGRLGPSSDIDVQAAVTDPSPSEIAELVGATTSTVGTRIYRGRRAARGPW